MMSLWAVEWSKMSLCQGHERCMHVIRRHVICQIYIGKMNAWRMTTETQTELVLVHTRTGTYCTLELNTIPQGQPCLLCIYEVERKHANIMQLRAYTRSSMICIVLRLRNVRMVDRINGVNECKKYVNFVFFRKKKHPYLVRTFNVLASYVREIHCQQWQNLHSIKYQINHRTAV